MQVSSNVTCLRATSIHYLCFLVGVFEDYNTTGQFHAKVDKNWKMKWSGSISCIEFFDWLILFRISTSWKGLWNSLYIYNDWYPTSEITQLTVNNTCGTSWSNSGQKHKFLVMCVHSDLTSQSFDQNQLASKSMSILMSFRYRPH